MAKGKGFIAEFKKFIMRGNVIDLAVGVIIGGAFQKIVNSLVNNVMVSLHLRRFCDCGGCESGRCCDSQLRYVYRHGAGLFDYGVCDFCIHQNHQHCIRQAEKRKARRACRTDNQSVSVLQIGN